MPVRLKFVCVSRIEGATDSSINFHAVYHGSEENAQFFRYTPSGNLVFNTVNKDAAKQFETGKEYYIDITPAGE